MQRKSPSSRFIIQYILTTLFMVGACLPVHSQMIDTIRERDITTKDRVNQYINIISRMVVTAKQPQRVTRKGKKIKNGYDTYYIHVMRSREVWIKITKTFKDSSYIFDVQKYLIYHGLEKGYLDSAKIINRNNVPIYLAIATKSKKLDHFKTTFVSNALFLKGIIDNTDSLIFVHEQDVKNYQYLIRKFSEWSKQKTNLYPSLENEINKLIQERNQLRGGEDVQDEDSLTLQPQKKRKKDAPQDSTQVQEKKPDKNPHQSALEKKKQEQKQKKQEQKKKKKEEKKKKKEAKKKQKEGKKKQKKKEKTKDTTHKTVKDSSKIWRRMHKKLDKQQVYKPKMSKIEQKIATKNFLIKELSNFRKSIEWVVLNDYEVEKEDSLILKEINAKLYQYILQSQEKQKELQMYKDFKASKKSDRKLLKFFLSHYFAVSFKYNIRTNPYDLPHLYPDEPTQKGISVPDQEKHKVRKKGWRKLLFWKKN